MTRTTSRNNSNLEFLYAQLDEVRMSGHERLRAKASLARAEAIADLVVEFTDGVKRLLKTLVVRPIRRLIASVG